MAGTPEGLRRAVGAVPAWYHTLELAPGVVTPGYFDLRPVAALLPWPDVRGKRCLDVGAYDGFYAFELERRGASEVVALDVADPRDWDWPPDARATGPASVIEAAGDRHAAGFEVARSALGSAVERVNATVYEAGDLGEFDVVLCGSLLLHLRDPLRALEAIRRVCRGWFLSIDEVRVGLSYRSRRLPLADIDGSGHGGQWMIPNARARRAMLEASGFDVIEDGGLLAIPFGPAHPATIAPEAGLRAAVKGLPRRLAGLGIGVPHSALLAAPGAVA